MPNVFWYIILAIVSSFIFMITLIKTKDSKVMALYTFISGLTYLFEYITLVIFKSYVYDPDVLKDAYFDSILGSMASNAFTVPMIGSFIVGLNLQWKWILGIVGIILIIEKCFLLLHIYFHFWWRIGYTAICLTICFMIAKRWYKILHENISLYVRFASIFFTGLLIQASIVFFAVALFGGYYYTIGWFENPSRDHIAFATAYVIFLSLIFTILMTFKMGWMLRIGIIMFTLLLDWALYNLGILHILKDWTLIYFFSFRLTVLVLLEIFSKKCLNKG